LRKDSEGMKMGQVLRRKVWLITVVLVLGNFLCIPAAAQYVSGGASPVEIESNWQYSWGDLPSATQEPAWTPIDYPPKPAEQKGEDTIWFQVHLPAGDWREPTLYFQAPNDSLEIGRASCRERVLTSV
jgi:hypothetical protein